MTEGMDKRQCWVSEKERNWLNEWGDKEESCPNDKPEYIYMMVYDYTFFYVTFYISLYFPFHFFLDGFFFKSCTSDCISISSILLDEKTKTKIKIVTFNGNNLCFMIDNDWLPLSVSFEKENVGKYCLYTSS